MSEIVSKAFKSVDYNPDANSIAVEFHNGSKYRWSGVTQEVYDGLVKATSKGSYFWQHIGRNRSLKKEKLKDKVRE